MKIGLIGGSGVYRFAGGKGAEVETIPIETPFGDVEVQHTEVGGRDLFFFNRHGKGHTTPPHLINYRANIHAMKAAGVTRVLATSAVGSMNPAIKPGDFVVLDEFLDFTKGRESTFSTVGDVFHVDMGEAFCEEIREVIIQNSKFKIQNAKLKKGIAEGKKGLLRPVPSRRLGTGLAMTGGAGSESDGPVVHERGVYVCAEGPRFETPAEIRAFRMLGGDVVGMTAVPECVLAREAGICYAGIAVATNWAAGMTANPLTPDEVNEMMANRSEMLYELLLRAIAAIPERRSCACSSAREKGRVRP